MRQLESGIRNLKRKEAAYSAVGDDQRYTDAVIKHRRLFSEYEKFAQATGNRTQLERLSVAELNKVFTSSVEDSIINKHLCVDTLGTQGFLQCYQSE